MPFLVGGGGGGIQVHHDPALNQVLLTVCGLSLHDKRFPGRNGKDGSVLMTMIII